jgi:UrcA family protein
MKIEMFLLAAATSLAAVPAAAGEVQSPQEAVRYIDLDLTSLAGQSALNRRIDSAARSVCKMDEGRIGSMFPAPGARECYERARASAQTQVAELIARERRAG